MLRHMRITIDLPDNLILLAKKAALEADTTLTEIVADALRTVLSRRGGTQARCNFKVITYGSGGLQAGVDLDDTSALLDRMDGLVDPDRS
jgi:hypothetical protein